MEIHRGSNHFRPYPPPRKNVLLLSCMDLRLIDDLVPFMEGDNLNNRYDQLVFAGAALGVIQKDHASWYDVFFQHLDIAVQLHDIRDVYLMEHRNCGAYEKFLGKKGEYGDSAREMRREERDHRKYAFQLRDKIFEHCANKVAQGAQPEVWDVHVRCFLMDLRGSVLWLKDDGSDESCA